MIEKKPTFLLCYYLYSILMSLSSWHCLYGYTTKKSNSQKIIHELNQKYQKDKLKEFYIPFILGLKFEKIDLEKSFQFYKVAKKLGDDFENSVIQTRVIRIYNLKGEYGSAFSKSKQLLEKRSFLKSIEDGRAGVYIQYLVALHGIGKKKKFISDYFRYRHIIRNEVDFDRISKKVAESLIGLNRFEEAQPLVEGMLVSYPLTLESVWALDYLLKKSSMKDRKQRYYFSKSALFNLMRNKNLQIGVSNLVESLVDGKIRSANGNISSLNQIQKIRLLNKLKLYEKAFVLAEDFLSLFKSSKYLEQINEVRFIKGQILNKLGNHTDAAQEFSRVYPSAKVKKAKILESFADSLRYAGYRNSASKIYSKVDNSDIASFKISQWYSFWTSYQSKNFDQLNKLYTKKFTRQFPIRDEVYPEAKLYWRAKYYESIGRFKKAKKLYSRVIGGSSDRIYNYFLASQKPSLIIESGVRNRKFYHFPSSQWLSTIGEVSSTCNISTKNRKYSLVSKLCYYEEKELARKILASEKWNHKDLESLKVVLSLSLASHSYNKVVRILDEAFKLNPSSKYGLNDVRESQAIHRSFWEIYYPLAFPKIVEYYSKKFEVDKFLLLSIMRAESVYSHKAESWVGALGLMQIMPYTGLRISTKLAEKRFHPSYLKDPIVNISYSFWYLKYLKEYFKDNLIYVIAAYNGGPKAVNRWIKRCGDCEADEFIETISYKETRNYVKKVLRNYGRYMSIYSNHSISPIISSFKDKNPIDNPDFELF